MIMVSKVPLLLALTTVVSFSQQEIGEVEAPCADCRQGVCFDEPITYPPQSQPPFAAPFLFRVFEWHELPNDPNCYGLFELLWSYRVANAKDCLGREFQMIDIDHVYYVDTGERICVQNGMVVSGNPSYGAALATAAGGQIGNHPEGPVSGPWQAPSAPTSPNDHAWNCVGEVVGLAPGVSPPPGATTPSTPAPCPVATSPPIPVSGGGFAIPDPWQIAPLLHSIPGYKDGKDCEIPPAPPEGTIVYLWCVNVRGGIPVMSSFTILHAAKAKANGKYTGKPGLLPKQPDAGHGETWGGFPAPGGTWGNGFFNVRICGFTCIEPN